MNEPKIIINVMPGAQMNGYVKEQHNYFGTIQHISSDGNMQNSEDAEVIEEVKDSEESSINLRQTSKSYETTLTVRRQEILDQLLALVDKGDWKHEGLADGVKQMMRTVLGLGETPLTGKEAELSEALWHLLENQRGDRVKIVWQNIVGYLDEKKLFSMKGSPALNRDFFGNDDGYTNIDKGRPSRNNMSNGFRDVLPLLDAYVPKLDKKHKKNVADGK